MQLVQIDTKLADRPQDQLGQQGGPVGVEESVQGPPNPVIVEQPRLALFQADERRLSPGSPLRMGIDGLAVVEHDVAQQNAQGLGVA